MKNRHAVLALITVACLVMPGVVHADSVQYDFLTTVRIDVDGVTVENSINNATLSFIVDWTTIDYSGPTTATGTITSIFASFPSNSTSFSTALLNDNTPSVLSPYFSTLGFSTTQVGDADAELQALDTTLAYSPLNEITASDPFGPSPFFGGSFILGSAFQDDSTPTTSTSLFRDYSFALSANLTGGAYVFDEFLANTYFFDDYDNFLFDFGSESVAINYQAQLTNVTPMPTPVPLPGAAVLIGIGMTTLALRRRFCAR